MSQRSSWFTSLPMLGFLKAFFFFKLSFQIYSVRQDFKILSFQNHNISTSTLRPHSILPPPSSLGSLYCPSHQITDSFVDKGQVLAIFVYMTCSQPTRSGGFATTGNNTCYLNKGSYVTRLDQHIMTQLTYPKHHFVCPILSIVLYHRNFNKTVHFPPFSQISDSSTFICFRGYLSKLHISVFLLYHGVNQKIWLGW